MDVYTRHRLIWQIGQRLLRLLVPRIYHFQYEPIRQEGPILLISNHVSALDPLFVAVAMGGKQIYYVASEHIFRLGFLSKVIRWLVSPIPRRKGAASFDTAKECLAHLKAGRSVCIFAEGEQSWDGRSIPVVQGTGSLAQASGARLVTYRLDGGYFSLPRWGRGLRQGLIRGRITGVYPAETLAGMTKERITLLMNQGIRENAWERQKKEKTRFSGKNPAEYLERLLYLCPGCGCIGTLHSGGDRLKCPCGLNLRYTELCSFDPAIPFATLAEWEDWQKEQLRCRRFVCDAVDGCLFSDAEGTLERIGENHGQTLLGAGRIAQYEDRLECGGRSFPLEDIQDMAMTQANRLLFTCRGGYYQLRVQGTVNLRKYLEIWKEYHQ